MWQEQLMAFADTHRVIAYDIRGHGHSHSGSMEFSISQFGDDLVLLMDALAIDRAILCGLSMGGYIALSVLENFPQRISALVLCDTQCIADSPETRDRRMRTIGSIRLSGIITYADEMITNLFAKASFTTKPAAVAFIKKIILGTSSDTVTKTLWALASRSDTCSILPTIKVPTLVVVGKEDKITPVEAAQKMQELTPGSSLEIIDGAGHLSNLENPEAFNAVLKRFLREL
jgi:pimeloyl-ACP methyl ester carboxylesterase